MSDPGNAPDRSAHADDTWGAAARSELTSVAPNLRPLWDCLAADVLNARGDAPPSEVLRLLKQVVVGRIATGKRAWRLYCRLPEDGVRALTDGPRWLGDIDLAYWRLRAASMIAFIGELPADLRLLRRMVSLYIRLCASGRQQYRQQHLRALANRLDTYRLHSPTAFAALLRAQCRESHRRRHDMHAFMGELSAVEKWFFGDLSLRKPFAFDQNQCRAPWRWYVQRALEFEYMVAFSAAMNSDDQVRKLRWCSLVLPFRHGDAAVIPLTSLQELFEASDALENCAYLYWQRCGNNQARLFSIRADGDPPAMCSLRFSHGNWHLDQVRVARNAPATERAQDAALAVEQRYRAAHRTLVESPRASGGTNASR